MELTADFGQFFPRRPLIAAPASGSARMIQRWLRYIGIQNLSRFTRSTLSDGGYA